MSAAEQTPAPAKLPRILAIIVAAIGVVMLVVGIAFYAFTSSELKAQNITVSAFDANDKSSLVGKTVAGPFTAWHQRQAIAHHVGTTYSKTANITTNNGVTYSADIPAADPPKGTVDVNTAHKKGDPLSDADATAWALRQSAMNGSFLQASLLVSILAFGMSAFIAGCGITVALIGLSVFLSQGSSVKKSASTDATA